VLSVHLRTSTEYLKILILQSNFQWGPPKPLRTARPKFCEGPDDRQKQAAGRRLQLRHRRNRPMGRVPISDFGDHWGQVYPTFATVCHFSLGSELPQTLLNSRGEGKKSTEGSG